MRFIKKTVQRYRRFFILSLSFLIFYSLMGFFAAPWLAKKALTMTLNERLGIHTNIKKIAFNPFTFALTVNTLQMETADNEPLIAWDNLYVNVNPIHLIKLDFIIDEITVSAPKLYFRRFSATDNTLARLVKKWSETAKKQQIITDQQETGDESALVTFKLNALNYVQGELHYEDFVPSEKFETVLTPINVHLNDFSTQSGQVAQNHILIELEKNAVLSINGNLILSPLHLEGRLNLKNLSLETPYRYLKAMLPFELKHGRLNLDLAYTIDINDVDVDFKISQIELDVAEFAVHDFDDETPLLKAGQFSLTGGELSYPERKFDIAHINLADYKLIAKKNENGERNWLKMLDKLPGKEPKEATQKDGAIPLKLNIESITTKQFQLEIEDKKTETPLNLAININSELKGFNLESNNLMPVNLELTLDSGGSASMNGDIQFFPAFTLNSTLSVKELGIQPIQSYLSQFAFITLKKGFINSETKISSDQDEPLSLQGNVALVDAQLDNQKLNNRLLSVDKLALNNIDFSLSKQSLAVSEVILDKLFSRIHITKDGETNVSLLIRESQDEDRSDKTLPSERKSVLTTLSIGKVTLNDASSSFTDENLPIAFHADMKKLNGSLSGFSSKSKQPMNIALEGQVDEFGLVEITGQMNPIKRSHHTDIKLAFTNLALPDLTPYTIKFAGRKIDEGTADIDLEYKIFQGELNANNKVVIRDIRLGERVKSADAMDLPLDLAIALLENSDGVIDISIPVTGNVNHPEFDMGPVMRAAISRVITSIVTAPFHFLASLIADGGEPVEDLRFRPGRSDISPLEQEKLLQLAEALQKRPQLALRIPAAYDLVADTKALKVRALEARIESKLQESPEKGQLVEKTQLVLESLYKQAQLAPSLEVIKMEIIEASKSLENPEGELDVLALNAKLQSSLVEVEPISKQELIKLANTRQKAVMTFLQTKGKLTEQQLQAGDAIPKDAKKGWIILAFELEVI